MYNFLLFRVLRNLIINFILLNIILIFNILYWPNFPVSPSLVILCSSLSSSSLESLFSSILCVWLLPLLNCFSLCLCRYSLLSSADVLGSDVYCDAFKISLCRTDLHTFSGCSGYSSSLIIMVYRCLRTI